MESNKTILYYTSNHENPVFEGKIIQNIKDNCGNIPIISVSQDPIDMGMNICVGRHGNSYLNAFRQMLIGAREVKSEYIVFCESDFLYPSEYFEFIPDGHDLYRYDNVWIVFRNISRYYCRKHFSNGAQIAKRDFVVKTLEEYLDGAPEWSENEFRVVDIDGKQKPDWGGKKHELFHGDVACVSFKTGDGVTKSSVTMSGQENKVSVLPHWGDINELKKKYL